MVTFDVPSAYGDFVEYTTDDLLFGVPSELSLFSLEYIKNACHEFYPHISGINKCHSKIILLNYVTI